MLRPLAPLTGLLPAEDQLRLERDYGVPASRATLLSALVLFAASSLVLVLGLLALAEHDFGSWNGVVSKLLAAWPLVFYMALESRSRMGAAVSTTEPVGSLPIAGPILLVRSFRDTLRGTRRAPRTPEHAFSTLRDTVGPWPGPDADLEVRSRLPKGHWTVNTSLIHYRGTSYLPVDRQELEEGVERYRFLLWVPDREILATYVLEYEPEEVREIYREQQRRAASTWVETFAFLWGFLDHSRQERLVATYDRYDPRKMTLFSLVFSGLLAALAIIWGVMRVGSDGSLAGVLGIIVGLVLAWEAMVRLGHWRAGRWLPSFVGMPLRPLADGFLRWQVAVPNEHQTITKSRNP